MKLTFVINMDLQTLFTDQYIFYYKIEPKTFPAKIQSMATDNEDNFKFCNHGKMKAQDLLGKLYPFAKRQYKTFPENDELITDFDLTNCLLNYCTTVSVSF